MLNFQTPNVIEFLYFRVRAGCQARPPSRRFVCPRSPETECVSRQNCQIKL